MYSGSPILLQGKCAVCGDRANHHVHYGAVCCYSCRAFFRRAIEKKLECITGRNNCIITPANRTECKKCRYRTCIEAGMLPSSVDATIRKKIQAEQRTQLTEFAWPKQSSTWNIPQLPYTPVITHRPQHSGQAISAPKHSGKSSNSSSQLHSMSQHSVQIPQHSTNEPVNLLQSHSRESAQNTIKTPYYSSMPTKYASKLPRHMKKLSRNLIPLQRRKSPIRLENQELDSGQTKHFLQDSAKGQKHLFSSLQQPKKRSNSPSKLLQHFSSPLQNPPPVLHLSPPLAQDGSQNYSINAQFPLTSDSLKFHRSQVTQSPKYPVLLEPQQSSTSSMSTSKTVFQREKCSMPEEHHLLQTHIQSSQIGTNQSKATALHKWSTPFQIESIFTNGWQSSSERNKCFSGMDRKTEIFHDQYSPLSKPVNHDLNPMHLELSVSPSPTGNFAQTPEGVWPETLLSTALEDSTYQKRGEHSLLNQTTDIQLRPRSNYSPQSSQFSAAEIGQQRIKQNLWQPALKSNLWRGKLKRKDPPEKNGIFLNEEFAKHNSSHIMEKFNRQTAVEDSLSRYWNSIFDKKRHCSNLLHVENSNEVEHFYNCHSDAVDIQDVYDDEKEALNTATVTFQSVIAERSESISSVSMENSHSTFASYRERVDTLDFEEEDEDEDNHNPELDEEDSLELGNLVDDTDEEQAEMFRSSSTSNTIDIPFKKRKHIPKSRFIHWSKVPIFHLTVEEEFRIHNIEFRRGVIWKEYVRRMKTKNANFEEVKSQIFMSAFGSNKVHLDPQTWWVYSMTGIDTHTETVRMYEEIAALPEEIWLQISKENTKTWSTYSWALCWANVDASCLVEQESKAGFWDQAFQEIYDRLFPNNPQAVKSLKMEDWDFFLSPWAASAKDEEDFTKTMVRVEKLTGKDRLLSTLYGLLIYLTPSSDMLEYVQNDPTLLSKKMEISRLIYRYLRSTCGSSSEAALKTEELRGLIRDLHICKNINFNRRINLNTEYTVGHLFL